MYLHHGRAECDSVYGMRNLNQKIMVLVFLYGSFNLYYRFVIKARIRLIEKLLLLLVTYKYYLLLGNPHPPFIIKTIYSDCYLFFMFIQTGK